jgi:hypothetical protein
MFREVAHPGVITSSHDNEEERRYVTYYQWVGFTLFFQVLTFTTLPGYDFRKQLLSLVTVTGRQDEM